MATHQGELFDQELVSCLAEELLEFIIDTYSPRLRTKLHLATLIASLEKVCEPVYFELRRNDPVLNGALRHLGIIYPEWFEIGEHSSGDPHIMCFYPLQILRRTRGVRYDGTNHLGYKQPEQSAGSNLARITDLHPDDKRHSRLPIHSAVSGTIECVPATMGGATSPARVQPESRDSELFHQSLFEYNPDVGDFVPTENGPATLAFPSDGYVDQYIEQAQAFNDAFMSTDEPEPPTTQPELALFNLNLELTEEELDRAIKEISDEGTIEFSSMPAAVAMAMTETACENLTPEDIEFITGEYNGKKNAYFPVEANGKNDSDQKDGLESDSGEYDDCQSLEYVFEPHETKFYGFDGEPTEKVKIQILPVTKCPEGLRAPQRWNQPDPNPERAPPAGLDANGLCNLEVCIRPGPGFPGSYFNDLPFEDILQKVRVALDTIDINQPIWITCPHVYAGTCMRYHKSTSPCVDKIHLYRVFNKFTDIRLGQCSYLAGCYNKENCPYVHFDTLLPTPENRRTFLDAIAQVPRIIEAFGGLDKIRQMQMPQVEKAQWIKADILKLELSVLGNFQCIIMDPPWKVHMKVPYGRMSDSDVLSLKIGELMDEGVMFLWCTARSLLHGENCLKEWGFRLVDRIIWYKTNQAQATIISSRNGHWLNHNKETCLVGLKGDPKWLNKQTDYNVIPSEVRETSRKPEQLYGVAERLCGHKTKKLELFGRSQNIRDGWLTVGYQLPLTSIHDRELQIRYADYQAQEARRLLQTRPGLRRGYSDPIIYSNKSSVLLDLQASTTALSMETTPATLTKANTFANPATAAAGSENSFGDDNSETASWEYEDDEEPVLGRWVYEEN